MSHTLTTVLRALTSGAPVDSDGFLAAFSAIDANQASPAEVGCLLGALAARARSDDAAQLTRACRTLQPLVTFHGRAGSPTVNLVGTGGGRATFNITTATSFLLASAGVTVIKTGSAAYTSRSGFAETAAALGVLRNLEWGALEELASRVGIALVSPARYAPVLAKMAKAIAPTSFRSVGGFINACGPLLSPVAVDHRIYGASSESLEALLIESVALVGDEPTTVVFGREGIDEVSPLGPTRLTTLMGGGRSVREIVPSSLPLPETHWDDLAGADPRAAARLIEDVLSGRSSPQRTAVVALNAAVYLHALGLETDLPTAFARCQALLQEGAAQRKLVELRAKLAA